LQVTIAAPGHLNGSVQVMFYVHALKNLRRVSKDHALDTGHGFATTAYGMADTGVYGGV
jgi:hypothetical protein